MTLMAVQRPGGLTMLPLFGLATIPMWATPWGSLILTSILIPRASFLGHLAGILAGYLVAFGPLSAIGPWPAIALLAAALAALAVQAARSGQLAAALQHLPLPAASADVEAGSGGSSATGGGSGGVRIVGGQIQRR